MRIAVNTQDFNTVATHVGRARRFLVFEPGLEGEMPELHCVELPRKFILHGYSDSEAHPLDGVEVLLTQSVGAGLTRRLARRGIRVVCTAETDAKKAVKDFLKGKLSPPAPQAQESRGEPAAAEAC